MRDSGMIAKCPRCGTDVLLSASRIRNHYYVCNACNRERLAAFHLANPYLRSHYSKTWRQNNPEKCREDLRKRRCNAPEKNRARNLLNIAVREGTLTRQPCQACGKKAQAHHEDYSKPLEVIWVCQAHHCALHRKTWHPCTVEE